MLCPTPFAESWPGQRDAWSTTACQGGTTCADAAGTGMT